MTEPRRATPPLRKGHAGVVELLLARGADPNKARTDTGGTPCYVAAQKGHAGVVELLLARGADPNKARTDDGATPCFIAALNGHAGVVELLLARGADPNKATTDDGATPCWAAAAKGHVEIVRLLVARGASLRAMPPLHPDTPPALATYLNGAREWTPLHVAADARDVAALRALLRDARVDPRLAVRAVLPDMRTALSIAGSASYPMARPFMTRRWRRQRQHARPHCSSCDRRAYNDSVYRH